MSIFSKALRMGEGKRLRELEQLAVAVNALEPEIEELSDEELAARTPWFRERLAAGETLKPDQPVYWIVTAGRGGHDAWNTRLQMLKLD